VDQYSVSFDTPSVSSLGSMPLGNGRTTANTWVDASNGDLVLLLGENDSTRPRPRRRTVCSAADLPCL